MSGHDYIDQADDALDQAFDPPLSLDDYVDRVLEQPQLASQSTKYLLEAIESMGTRTVIEAGEEKERYEFFDDPANNGEHAILGNTDVLNKFVDDLRSIAAGRGKEEKIIWFDGPTATGKSELKRCLVNGLRAYSKTPDGRRYTMEWNIASSNSARGLSYGDTTDPDEDDWHRSPVQSHPLTVFPPEVREGILAEVNANDDSPIDNVVDTEMDPFCREAYQYLVEQYNQESESDVFSKVTSADHLRITNYLVDVGQGIGILHSEDEGRPKERLVGSWMRGMLQELDSRGRKNPQAFSYDGVLSQGNSLLTIVEDASQHADLLEKLLNIPDENSVKLDKGIGMDIDTQLIVISNPDLELQLNQHADKNGMDPYKALKRRLEKHEFRYLRNLSLEAQLIRREITGDTALWKETDYNQIQEKMQAPISLETQNITDRSMTRELAPHTLEAAALYTVVSRLDRDDLPDDLNLVEKALLYDRGYITRDGNRVDADEFEFSDTDSGGRHGIPVTYTRDVIASLLHEEIERSHEELDVESVLLPRDVLDALVQRLPEEPLFSQSEANEFATRLEPVVEYTETQQEEDVLQAMLRDRHVDDEAIGEYIDHVYAWGTDEKLTNSRGEEIEPDALKMKVFEVEKLGKFTDEDYTGNDPSDEVAEFRDKQVIRSLNRMQWENRNDEFTVSEVDYTEIPAIQDILTDYDWAAVKRIYEDFDPSQWESPPENTETAQVKQQTIANMVEMFGYSEASAELTSKHIVNHISDNWSDI